MTTGYGSSGYGTTGYGGPPGDFALLSASAASYRFVDLVFSADLAGTVATTDPASYDITNGVTVLGVTRTASDTVRLQVDALVSGVVYEVTVTPALTDSTGRTITTNTAFFTGLGPGDAYVVASLDARTDCRGKIIYLTWTNPETPAPPASVRIVRRVRAWPFDLTDTFDDLYNGTPVTEFIDSGILQPIHYIAVAAAVGDTVLHVDDATGVTTGMALRVEVPTAYRQYDLVTVTGVTGTAVTVTPALANAYAIGSRVAQSKPLLGNTYYYYLVLASQISSPTDSSYSIQDASRTFALSIDEMDSKDDFLWAETPREYAKQDALSLEEGGGGGFLDKLYQIMGCWINLMRGYGKAIALLGDDNNAPIHALAAKNYSLGFAPEGFAYDFDVLRRTLLSLAFIYKRKGSCPGIQEVVSMLTKWDATCVDLGVTQCAHGATSAATWDGETQLDYGTGNKATITQTGQAPDILGKAIITDPAKAGVWTNDQWASGMLRGWIGDLSCVLTNLGDALITDTPTAAATIVSISGPQDVVVDTVAPFTVGMIVAFAYSADAPHIHEISAIDTGTLTLSVRSPFFGGSPTPGGSVFIQKSDFRAEYGPIETGCTGSGQVITDPGALFVENQWKGYQISVSDGELRNVVSNTQTTITVDGSPVPATPTYAIAYQYDPTFPNYATRSPIQKYRVSSGVVSTTYEPTYDLQENGTLYDALNRSWQGSQTSLLGAWSPTDIGVYITNDPTLLSGRAVSATGAVLTLDPAATPPTANALVGDFLNPNQNQTQLFEITANTSTTITVTGDISSLVQAGQYYYVLSPRDAIKFGRLVERLKEFVEPEFTCRVLFF